jgi:hypothetical protein
MGKGVGDGGKIRHRVVPAVLGSSCFSAWGSFVLQEMLGNLQTFLLSQLEDVFATGTW